MYAEAAVEGGAVEAEEDAVGDGGPGGVLGVAVEAHLIVGFGAELAEDGAPVGGAGVGRHRGEPPTRSGASPRFLRIEEEEEERWRWEEEVRERRRRHAHAPRPRRGEARKWCCAFLLRTPPPPPPPRVPPSESAPALYLGRIALRELSPVRKCGPAMIKQRPIVNPEWPPSGPCCFPVAA